MAEETSKLIEESFRLLEEAYGDSVARYVRSIYFREGRNEEFLQEAIYAIKKAEKTFNPELGKLDHYLIKSIKNQVLKVKSKSSRERPFSAYEGDEKPEFVVGDFSLSPEQILEALDDSKAVLLAAAFSSLTTLEKTVVFSVLYLRLSLSEIALSNDIKYYALYKVYREALQKLRDQLTSARESLLEVDSEG